MRIRLNELLKCGLLLFLSLLIYLNFLENRQMESESDLVRHSLPLIMSTAPKPVVHKEPKIVVLWTRFYGDAQWSEHFKRNNGPTYNVDNERSCLYTPEHKLVAKADAVIFHGRDFRNTTDIPNIRFPWQRWVYYLIESTAYSGVSNLAWPNVNAIGFNWSMSYNKKADIQTPYHNLRTKTPFPKDSREYYQTVEKITNFTASFVKRPRDAVWFVSDCFSVSAREVILNTLQRNGLAIDAWGKCSGRNPAHELERLGLYRFFSRYRFVLSFENSLCDEYITEKNFMALHLSYSAGTIPIVYGGAFTDYDRILPKGSFVNALSFPNDTSLAKYLQRFSSNLTTVNASEVEGYYRWFLDSPPRYEKGEEIDVETGQYEPEYAKRWMWKNLCERLWREDSSVNNYSKIISDLKSRLDTCHYPNHTYLDLKNFSDKLLENGRLLYKVSSLR